ISHHGFIRIIFVIRYVYGQAHLECGRPRGFASKTIRETTRCLHIGNGGSLSCHSCRRRFPRLRRYSDSSFGPRSSQECGHGRVSRASGGKIPVKRILFDTNVVLDVLLNRQPFVEASAAAWAAIESRISEGMLAAHAVTTIHYLIRKELGVVKAKRIVAATLRVFAVAAVDNAVILEALQ